MLQGKALVAATQALRQARNAERGRLDQIRRYHQNRACDIYAPDEASDEYRLLIDQAKFNFLPLVTSTVAQRLKVVGYRSSTDEGQSELWGRVWQPNRLDKRQSTLHRTAIQYGAAYTVVLPGKPGPVIRCLSPFRCTALYDDPVNDEWPTLAMTWDRDEALAVSPEVAEALGKPRLRVFDDAHEYVMEIDGEPKLVEVKDHDLGVCPVVRFSVDEDLDEVGRGKVEPLIPVQQQVNQTTFRASMTEQFQAFRQRWATGLLEEIDPETGQPIEPYKSWVDSIWTNESVDARFGEFEEANLGQYLDQRASQLTFAAAVSKIPPYYLLIGGVANISLDTITALEAAHRQDVEDHQDAFGESWEQSMRLAARAMGDEVSAVDESAEVVWGDTTPRSLGQLIDALGKMAQMLGVPVQALWERIPGVSDQDIERWAAMNEGDELMNELQGLLDAEPVVPPPQQESVGAVSSGDAPDNLA